MEELGLFMLFRVYIAHTHQKNKKRGRGRGAHFENGEGADEEGVVGGDAEVELIHGLAQVRAQGGEADVGDPAG